MSIREMMFAKNIFLGDSRGVDHHGFAMINKLNAQLEAAQEDLRSLVFGEYPAEVIKLQQDKIELIKLCQQAEEATISGNLGLAESLGRKIQRLKPKI
jgi:hypothetical protein